MEKRKSGKLGKWETGKLEMLEIGNWEMGNGGVEVAVVAIAAAGRTNGLPIRAKGTKSEAWSPGIAAMPLGYRNWWRSCAANRA